MDIELPAIPAGILALLSFFLPYAQALVQKPTWSVAQKRIVSIVAAVVLALIAMAFYYFITGDVLPSWPVAILLALTVAQTSYGLVTRESAKQVEVNAGLK